MKKLSVLLLVAAIIICFIWVNNNWIVTTEYTLQSEKIPETFSGKRIVQVSDLHNAEFGSGQSSLLSKVEKANPDVIFVTGDLIDSNRYDLETSLTAVDGLVEMAQVYYVIGNHEVSSNRLEEIVPALEERGVQVLRNRSVLWGENGQSVRIAGIDDPLMDTYSYEDDFTRNSLAEAGAIEDAFTLLLAHRPEQLEVYASEGIDAVFAGHAHGGQIRFPFLGGLIAPGQGWFPQMTEGVFQSGETQLVLSRGLGNSGFPVRVFNLPEIVVITLEKSE